MQNAEQLTALPALSVLSNGSIPTRVLAVDRSGGGIACRSIGRDFTIAGPSNKCYQFAVHCQGPVRRTNTITHCHHRICWRCVFSGLHYCCHFCKHGECGSILSLTLSSTFPFDWCSFISKRELRGAFLQRQNAMPIVFVAFLSHGAASQSYVEGAWSGC